MRRRVVGHRRAVREVGHGRGADLVSRTARAAAFSAGSASTTAFEAAKAATAAGVRAYWTRHRASQTHSASLSSCRATIFGARSATAATALAAASTASAASTRARASATAASQSAFETASAARQRHSAARNALCASRFSAGAASLRTCAVAYSARAAGKRSAAPPASTRAAAAISMQVFPRKVPFTACVAAARARDSFVLPSCTSLFVSGSKTGSRPGARAHRSVFNTNCLASVWTTRRVDNATSDDEPIDGRRPEDAAARGTPAGGRYIIKSPQVPGRRADKTSPLSRLHGSRRRAPGTRPGGSGSPRLLFGTPRTTLGPFRAACRARNRTGVRTCASSSTASAGARPPSRGHPLPPRGWSFHASPTGLRAPWPSPHTGQAQDPALESSKVGRPTGPRPSTEAHRARAAHLPRHQIDSGGLALTGRADTLRLNQRCTARRQAIGWDVHLVRRHVRVDLLRGRAELPHRTNCAVK